MKLTRENMLRRAKLSMLADSIKSQEKKIDGPIPFFAAEESQSSHSSRTRQPQNCQILKALLLDPINILLISAPAGGFLFYRDGSPAIVFSLCFVGLIPLAKLLGDATDHLAENFNQTIGGLLNATFGNAVECILTLNAIKQGLVEIVKMTLLGSILSNLLLVLGMSFFVGGLTMPVQNFRGTAAMINVTMLFVGILSCSVPTVFAFSAPYDAILSISRVSACFVGIGYVAYLFFQLYTHADIFEDTALESDSANGKETVNCIDECGGPNRNGEEDHAILGVPWALALLFISTVAVAFFTEFMVESVHGAVDQWHVPEAFVGVILLPIVGNACEHASAVRMAYQNKVATAIAIAIGSSTQIALLVMPFAVIAGWIADEPLDFNLGATGLAVLYSAVLVVFSIIIDSQTNWLEGFMLVLSYCLVAVLYWYTPNAKK
eukprot:CAMPEP_0117532768 /NCGR_PEP_ID=MMETSP0784-20121206/39538_1 /TAXON_ID=39447 /ORGANISM="" /LENGTH=434 /DNA_ID=CAMNT_0005329171 /DNA_START=135 /DNA_END=1439 /DNA_ORIENTATION=+